MSTYLSNLSRFPPLDGLRAMAQGMEAVMPRPMRDGARRARAIGPVLIHACTVEGKGYAPAEVSADKYHRVSRFDMESGGRSKSKPNAPSYTAFFGEALCGAPSRDPNVVGVTAAMPSGTGVNARIVDLKTAG